MAEVAGLLRVSARVRKTPCPRGLAAFKGWAFTAARAHGLTLAAFAARFDHARTVAAPDALSLRPASGCGFECSEFKYLLLHHNLYAA
jgi:hypothetical protein